MEIAFCIASGASLTQADVDYCKGKGKVYVVNDCYKLAPWADALYAADMPWWDYHKPKFKGEKITLDPEAAAKYGCTCIKYNPKLTWLNGDTIASGGNSGFQALNVAVLRGADAVILLGYDMGAKHWFGDHPQELMRPSPYKDWIVNFNRASPYITVPVINCSPNSALECFKKMGLKNAYDSLRCFKKSD